MGDERMEKITVYSGDCFPLRPDREEVFRWLQCSAEQPCYGAFAAVWDRAVALLSETAEPRAAALREAEDRLSILLTLGQRPEEAATRLFYKQDYITGSILNVLCDELLFQMDGLAFKLLKRDLARERLSVSAREEPGIDYPIEDQQSCLAQLRPVFPGVSISEHGIISPAKSMMYRVMLSHRDCGHVSLHDCSVCPQTDCLYRHVK